MSCYIASCIAGGLDLCILASPPARKLAGVRCSTLLSRPVCKRPGGCSRTSPSPAQPAPFCTLRGQLWCRRRGGSFRTVSSPLGCRRCWAPDRKLLPPRAHILGGRRGRIGCVARQSSSPTGYLCSRPLLFAGERWCSLYG